ncbi:hypothetical protein JW905_12440 [bacterium]|nr:hypothetical protein [candidate division CSSED10-310 bacterium]
MALFRKRRRSVVFKPAAAIAGGEVGVYCAGLDGRCWVDLKIHVDGCLVRPLLLADGMVKIRLPPGTTDGNVRLRRGDAEIGSRRLRTGTQLAVGISSGFNPIEVDGTIYLLDDSDGTPGADALIALGPSGERRVLTRDIPAPVAMCVAADGWMYVASLTGGAVYRVDSLGTTELFVTGIGLPAAIAAHPKGGLFIADKRGTLYRVDEHGAVVKFAVFPPTLESPRLCMSNRGELLITSPDPAETRPILAISPGGSVRMVFPDFCRPTAMCRGPGTSLLVAAHFRGIEGVFRLQRHKEPELLVAGGDIFGLARTSDDQLLIGAHGALYRISGRDL